MNYNEKNQYLPDAAKTEKFTDLKAQNRKEKNFKMNSLRYSCKKTEKEEMKLNVKRRKKQR